MAANYNTLKVNFSCGGIPSAYLPTASNWSGYPSYGAAYVTVYTAQTIYRNQEAYSSFWIPYSGKTVFFQQPTTTSRKYTFVIKRPAWGWSTTAYTIGTSSTSGVTTANIYYGGGSYTSTTYSLKDYVDQYSPDDMTTSLSSIEVINLFRYNGSGDDYQYGRLFKKEFKSIFPVGKTILIAPGWRNETTYSAAIASGAYTARQITSSVYNGIGSYFSFEPVTFSAADDTFTVVHQYNTPSTVATGGGSLTNIPGNRYITVKEFEYVEETKYLGENPFYNPDSFLYNYNDEEDLELNTIADSHGWSMLCGGDASPLGYRQYATNADVNVTNASPNARYLAVNNLNGDIPLICNSEIPYVLTSSTTIPFSTMYVTWPTSGSSSMEFGSKYAYNKAVFTGATNFYRAQVLYAFFSDDTHSTLRNYTIFNINSGLTAASSITLSTSAETNGVLYLAGAPNFSYVYPQVYFRTKPTSSSAWGSWRQGTCGTNYPISSIGYMSGTFSGTPWSASVTYTRTITGTFPSYRYDATYSGSTNIKNLTALQSSGITVSPLVPKYDTYTKTTGITTTYVFSVPENITAFTASFDSNTWFSVETKAGSATRTTSSRTGALSASFAFGTYIQGYVFLVTPKSVTTSGSKQVTVTFYIDDKSIGSTTFTEDMGSVGVQHAISGTIGLNDGYIGNTAFAQIQIAGVSSGIFPCTEKYYRGSRLYKDGISI